MRQLFISYARENKPDVEALIRDLDALGYQTWVDSSLRGDATSPKHRSLPLRGGRFRLAAARRLGDGGTAPVPRRRAYEH